MLSEIVLVLICIQINLDDNGNSYYLDKLTFYESKIDLEKKVKVKSYYNYMDSKNKLSPWEIDFEKYVDYNISKEGMYYFSVEYESQNEDTLTLKENIKGTLKYTVNSETFKYRTDYIEDVNKDDVLTDHGYCINANPNK